MAAGARPAGSAADPDPGGRGRTGRGLPVSVVGLPLARGDLAGDAPIADLPRFASDLAGFLRALGRVDATDGPGPGEHNFHRGGPLTTYAQEAHDAIAALGAEIRRGAVERVWEDAMRTTWDRDPVWFHGDVAVNNLLVRDGRLGAILDFGSCGVGDPACDVVIAWTFLSGAARDRFRADLGADAGTWSRGRGWALWKALITLVGYLERDSPRAALPRRDIREVLADYDEGR